MTAKELGEQSVIPATEATSTSKISSDGVITQQTTEVISTLTKREYFAGLAMQGFTSNDGWAKTVNPDDWDEYAERLADASVKIADALLKELAKEN